MFEGRMLVLAAAVLWSSAGAAMKLCQLSAPQIACGRSLIAGSFLIMIVPAARRRPSRTVILTGLAYAATSGLFTLANKLTTAANAIFLQSTAPLWVLLLSRRWLGEPASRTELVAVPLFALGLGLFFFDELSPGELTGNLIALVSGLAFAGCVVGLRQLSLGVAGPYAGMSAVVLGNAFTALFALPFCFAGPSPRAIDWAILVYLGVFQLGLAYFSFTRAVARIRAIEASLLTLLEPVLNPVWTFLLVGERPGPWALAGGAVVMLATLWRVLAPQLTARRQQPAQTA